MLRRDISHCLFKLPLKNSRFEGRVCVGILHGYVNKRLSNNDVLLFELILFTVGGCYTQYQFNVFCRTCLDYNDN